MKKQPTLWYCIDSKVQHSIHRNLPLHSIQSLLNPIHNTTSQKI